MESMTGYGTAEGKVGKGRLFVEIKSINHRFNEINVKIPPRMGVLEAHIRKCLTSKFSRGKLDVFFKEKEPLFGGVGITLDIELANQYKRLLANARKELGIEVRSDFLQIVGLDRILRVEEKEGSYERLWSQIVKLLDKASREVVSMRIREGAHIKRDQKSRLMRIQKLVKGICKQSDLAIGRHFDRLRAKVKGAAGQQVDEQRLQAEVAYLGGRQDIAEELLRLESHVKQYLDLLREKDPVGRKLDFLLQEMGREVNTIGAKAADAKISQMVVDCKSELERLREQIQNVQ
ncbi:MAG: YicC/YloC family endoribonuclease [Pseudomonadota bacterium]